MLKRTIFLAVALFLSLTAPAAGGTAADWIRTGESTFPIGYFQGITNDDDDVYFSGFVGIFRTDMRLRQERANEDVIDPAAKSDPGFNHIGDITFDEAERGRIILPLECYYPQQNPANTCGVGGFGVADAKTLAWRYWVKLDPADIPKAMWAEVSPDGRLIWTSTGQDLIAYEASDVRPANAQPAGPTIRPVRRLVGAVPAHGITGAVFVGPRLFLAGQDRNRFEVTSVNVTTGVARREIQETISGESEGLASFRALGGTFHWMVMPVPQDGDPGPPTFTRDKGTLLQYKARPTALALTVTPRVATIGRRTRFAFRVTDDNGDPVKGATVKLSKARARTDARGRAKVTETLRSPGRYTAVASKRGLRRARAVVRSSR